MGTGSTITTQTRNQLSVDTTVSRIFIFGNTTSRANLPNTHGADHEYLEGTILGVIAATGKLEIMKSGAADGSEKPVGVLLVDITILNAGNADVNYVYAGDVVEERLIFDGTDDLDEVVDGKAYREWLASDTVGIRLVKAGDNLTELDNS